MNPIDSPRPPFHALRPLVVALVFALGLACNAPFVPIPPPGTPTFSPVVTTDPGVQTLWETRGTAWPQGVVSIFNADQGAGVITRAAADGTYAAPPLDGAENDRIFIHYETPSGEASPSICRRLHPGPALDSCE